MASKGKWAYSHQASWAPQKGHFTSYNGSDHDIMQKRRLASRVFGFTRHWEPYSSLSLTQPPKECDAYASDEERHCTDVEASLKEVRRKERAKAEANLRCLKEEREHQLLKVLNQKEDAWQKEEDRVEFFRDKPHPRIQANRSGADYDIFTLQYKDSFAGQRLKYEDDCRNWRNNLRQHYLKTRSSSCVNYNIVNWQKYPSTNEPAKPSPPEPPAEKTGRQRRASVLSAPPKLQPSSDECPPFPQAKVDIIDYGPLPEPPEPEPKVRDIFVGEKHPWEQLI